MATEAPVQTPPEQDRWDLSELYPSEAEFDRALAAFRGRLEAVPDHAGHLSEGPGRLLAALTLTSELHREFTRLASYARMTLDLDTRDAASLARSQDVDLVGTQFEAAASFLAPEILALPGGTVEGYLASEPGLREFDHQLQDLLRRKPHTLSLPEERLLAESGVMAAAAEGAYSVLANADLPWPEATLSSGERIRLDQSAFVKYRGTPNRADRLHLFKTFFSAWQGYARTFGVMLDAEVKKNIFYARSRRYPSALAAALDRNHVPVAVYDAVVGAADEGLPTLHRYLKLRARLLGVADLSYHDIYAPLMAAIAREYTIEDARSLVLEALAPLGDGYGRTLAEGFKRRWVDVWPGRGKRSGAYSNGAVYGEHPFILLNFSGHFDGVSTLAHECGHAMHSHLANAQQPYPKAEYSIFVAEVASTFNEALLYRHCIAGARTDDERLALLASWLDSVRGTFFRQSMFAEFERELYRTSEAGSSLTGERLGEIYLELIRRYHGSSQGVCAIDDLYSVEWAYIPHFYANFYVFQYATGIAAATALASRVLAGAPGARDGYLAFLKAGGSDYPFETLKRAGVDLSASAPYKETIAEMNRVMDEMEQILGRRAEAGTP